MIFDRVLGELKDKKNRRHSGKLNVIPFPFKRFSRVLPGVEQGKYYIVTANSKVGKTQIADFLFVFSTIKYYIEVGKKNGIKLKIFYFSLEMSKEEKVKQLISYFLFIKKQMLFSPTKLESKFEYILEDDVINFLEEEKEFFETFEEIVDIYDDIRNPFGMYKEVRSYAYNNGNYYDNKHNVLPIDEIKKSNKDVTFKIDYYKPNNSDEYVIILTDTINLISPEKGQTLHQAMSKYSSEYCLTMRNKWNYIPVNIQQQSADSEKQQFTMGGKNIIDKLKPSPDGLADNKLIGRDCNYMIGLFSPNRYGAKYYNDYDLTKLKDNHRDLSIIFSRHSSGSQSISLLFLGAVNYFNELPKKMEDSDYEKVRVLQEKMKG